MRRLGLALVVLLACGCGPWELSAADGKPLRVFILAGQSNMEGHAKVETFDYLGDDPATAPLLARMRGPDGSPRTCDHVWISLFTGGETNGEAFGRLTAGYGARRTPLESDGKIGPEFTFGLAMDAALDEPVLIIKTAWGGKSLYYDFRPPSAGVYQQSADDVAKGRHPPEGSGRYYRLMIEHVRRVLADPKRVCPAYDPQAGYELGGFVWLQGWNDMVTREVYPEHPSDGRPRYADYSRWLADLIRDVRKDLDAPRLPFVIGVMGVGGDAPNKHVAAFRRAMAAPAELPEFQAEFQGNVVAVETAPFWDAPLGAIDEKREQVRQMGYFLKSRHKDHANADGSMDEKRQRAYLVEYEARIISPEEAAVWKRGASNAGYHYLGCAKTFALMGNAFAKAVLALRDEGDDEGGPEKPKAEPAARSSRGSEHVIRPGESPQSALDRAAAGDRLVFLPGLHEHGLGRHRSMLYVDKSIEIELKEGAVLRLAPGVCAIEADGEITTDQDAGKKLDDLRVGGRFDLSRPVMDGPEAYGNTIYTILIDGEGEDGRPDTFAWGDGRIFETTHTKVPITGDWQGLSHGVEIAFGRTTGHSKGSLWFVSYDGPEAYGIRIGHGRQERAIKHVRIFGKGVIDMNSPHNAQPSGLVKHINACVLVHGRVRDVVVEDVTMTNTNRSVMCHGDHSGNLLPGGAVTAGESFDAEDITIQRTRTLNPDGAGYLLGHPSFRGHVRNVKCNHNYVETGKTAIEPNFNLDGYEVVGNVIKSDGQAIHCWRRSVNGVVADNLRIHDNTGKPVVVVNSPRGWQAPEPPVQRNNRNHLGDAPAKGPSE